MNEKSEVIMDKMSALVRRILLITICLMLLPVCSIADVSDKTLPIQFKEAMSENNLLIDNDFYITATEDVVNKKIQGISAVIFESNAKLMLAVFHTGKATKDTKLIGYSHLCLYQNSKDTPMPIPQIRKLHTIGILLDYVNPPSGNQREVLDFVYFNDECVFSNAKVVNDHQTFEVRWYPHFREEFRIGNDVIAYDDFLIKMADFDILLLDEWQSLYINWCSKF